jgi:signal transduction histidine kinase/CheY-like chemotaxis protein
MIGSPLHGILGAAEFLAETASDAYQSGLVTSIVTCGRTLLDTLNHVLDYSKINKLGRAQMRRHAKQNKLITLSDSSLESLSMTGEFDLGVLVEEVAEAVSAGHAFKKLPVNGSVMTNQTEGKDSAALGNRHDSFTAGALQAHGEGGVSVLLDVSPRQSWRVRTQPGALRRIIMNLLGNALKYTSSGFVAVSLRAHENTGSSKTSCVIRIVDSGKGMSEQFQHDRMFVPFSQEDPFQPGTGLGLSIVKSIVDSLGGSMEVKSQVGVGTEIDVHLCLPPATDQISNAPEDELTILGRKTLNKHLVLLEPDPPRVLTHHISRLEETLRETCKTWFGMRVSKSKYMDRDDADIYLYSEPPSLEKLVERHRQAAQGLVPKRKTPIIVVYMSAEDAIATSRDQQKILTELGSIVEVIPQPCGPRKLAKILNICLQRAEELKNAAPNDCENPEPLPIEPQQEVRTPEPKHSEALEPASGDPNDLVKSMSAAVSYPSPPPFDPATPSLQPLVVPVPQPPNTARLNALIVDDNVINRQLLVMFMKKHKFSYSEAGDGQEALDAYKASCLPGPHSDAPTRRFDVVLMDISMPVMDGMESTRRIREFEKENGLTKSNVIALTGLASAQAQQEAEASGIDVFMPKPVKFADLKKLLTVKEKEEGK